MPSLVSHRHKAFIRQSHRCCYCGCLMWESDPEAFRQRHGLTQAEANLLRCTAEHLQARQDGGKDSAANIAAACLRCNQTRHRARFPLDPDRYGQRVRERVRKGGWHQPRACRLCDLALLEGPSRPPLPK